MGTLVIYRPNDTGGILRRLKVYIDVTEVAGLRPNKTYTTQVPDGPHQVRGRMDSATCRQL